MQTKHRFCLNLIALVLFLLIFMVISVGTPFILVTFLPTAHAMLGSLGISLVTGTVLYFVLVRMSGSKS